jgi:hypothetical protein
MGYLHHVLDSSIRVFMREVNSLRLLIINGAIPIMVISMYKVLGSVFLNYVVAIISATGYYIRPIIADVASFMGGLMELIAAVSALTSIVTSIFIVNGLVRGWRGELRAVYSLYRDRAGVIIHVITVLTLSSLYSYVIGIAVSVTLALIILKTLSSLGVLPLVNYSVDVVGTALTALPIFAILLMAYIITGITVVARHDLTP